MSNVCLCKGIAEEVIVQAIKDGANTVEQVSEKTGATTGGCRGARCKGAIQKLIEEHGTK